MLYFYFEASTEDPKVFFSMKGDDILEMIVYDTENMHKKETSHSIKASYDMFSTALHDTNQAVQTDRHLHHHQDEETKQAHQTVHEDRYIVLLFPFDTLQMFFGVHHNEFFLVSA